MTQTACAMGIQRIILEGWDSLGRIDGFHCTFMDVGQKGGWREKQTFQGKGWNFNSSRVNKVLLQMALALLLSLRPRETHSTMPNHTGALRHLLLLHHHTCSFVTLSNQNVSASFPTITTTSTNFPFILPQAQPWHHSSRNPGPLERISHHPPRATTTPCRYHSLVSLKDRNCVSRVSVPPTYNTEPSTASGHQWFTEI